ncbi:hypothetical protein Q1W73_08685 [Asticcacaulis sp. ZE23SCel15]|uniref:hypothetical protein n=1 Tax=Asticcacaulis sp. ZE23SCel15 TaxID=3059027 RepID=UPI00265E9287|nr:hypothetical protein [Asticcacaulis sp. ZE23SCel15]WKL55784.1 hypothetical protein Q1W73_08685 [Asticcacaulis sp. ZE23SCel15]
MSPNAPTQERYTPQERRARLRAFADRMLERLEDLPPSQDVAEIERTVRVGLLIERLYARVDAAERKAPPRERTPEELAADRRENKLHYQQFLARWGLSTSKPEPKPEPAPAPAPSTDWVDEFEGYGFEDGGLDDESEAVMSPVMPELDGKAAFKAVYRPQSVPDSS